MNPRSEMHWKRYALLPFFIYFLMSRTQQYALDTREALATPEHAAPLGAFCTQTPHHHCPTTRLLRAVPLPSPICDLGSPRPRITPSASLVSYSTRDAQHCNGTHEVVPTLPRHAHLCAAAFSMFVQPATLSSHA
ncbi:hypothetical protein C8J57DRAFT_1518784 [Mycena rebaudengoi]|nr:hypothetical protein C8J57DRAFT_1518784 [Mycena rebaudengoi]